MTNYTYQTIINKANECKTNVSKDYKCGISYKWSYYFAKALTTHTDVKKININDAPNPSKTNISRQISSATYLALAKKLTAFVEKNHRLPNYLAWKDYKISQRLYTYTFARCLIYYHKHSKYDDIINVNEKVFTKPVETRNEVYNYFTKKTGKKFKKIDDLLGYVQQNFKYQYYYDDHKSNKEVTDTKSGNCTDLLQWLCNMVEPMGYEWKCIHVKCRSSGGGHVFGKFKHPKNTEGNWITRDIACVANGGSVRCVWCSDGIVQATNPTWWMENLRR